jgi:hypothetical protein
MNTTTKPPTDWQALETEFVNGFTSYEDLAIARGINPATLRKRGERGGWTDKRHVLAQSVTNQAQEKLTISRVDELAQFNSDSLDAAKAIRLNAAARLENDGLTPNELRSLAGALEAAQRIGRLALGASTDTKEITGKDGKPLLQPPAGLAELFVAYEKGEANQLSDNQLSAIIAYGMQGNDGKIDFDRMTPEQVHALAEGLNAVDEGYDV